MLIMIVEGMKTPRGEQVWTSWMVLESRGHNCSPFLEVSIHVLRRWLVKFSHWCWEVVTSWRGFLVVIHWVSASASSLIAILMQWSKCHQQLKRLWLLSIRLIMLMKTCCWFRLFSMLWSLYMLMGLVFGSQTFSHSLGFVVDVGYLWMGKPWSCLNNSSWCVRLMGDGIGGRLETREYFDVMEAGEEPWINEGSTKGGQDSPSEVVIGIGLEIGVLMMMVQYSCWYEPLGIGWAICWDMSGWAGYRKN